MLLPMLVTLGCTQREPYYPPETTGISDTDTVIETDTDADTDTDTDTDTTAGTICEGRTVGVEVGDCAINFTLPDETGAMRSLWDDYGGQVIILDLSGFT